MISRLLRIKKADEADDDGALAPLRASGDVRLEGGAAFPLGLVTRGDLTLGQDACVEGNVQVAGSLFLDEGAQLSGDAVVEGDAWIAPGGRIKGRLTCRRLVLVADAEAGSTEETKVLAPQAA